MAPKVTLTAIAGSLKGQEFEFSERTVCIIGRASDCYPQLPNDQEHRIISRYHCLLDINPPMIRVRDFGSLNGTYINDEKIGQRPLDQTPIEGAQTSGTDYYDLKAGDEIKLGTTIFKVRTSDPEKYLQVLTHYNSHLVEQLFTDESSASASSEATQFVGENDFVSSNSDFSRLSGADADNYLPCLEGYVFLKLLGKSGRGKVYLAQRESQSEKVAIKVLEPQEPVSQYGIDVFLRDLENTQSLNHENIVKLSDFRYEDGVFWLVQEYCEQGSVADLIQSQGVISIDAAISIILQVLEGLEYAHQAKIPHVKLPDGSWQAGAGMIHRDLKPSNLLLTQVQGKSVIKIGDYGIAKAFDLAGLSGLSFSDSVARMPYFLPRHQVLDFKSAAPKIDVWATAAILYYMLTGEYARDFSGNKDPWLVVLQNQPIPIWKRDASIPIWLAEILDRALVEKPSVHFKTAGEFKRSLASLRKS